jgi:multidrug resistance efflux pump
MKGQWVLAAVGGVLLVVTGSVSAWRTHSVPKSATHASKPPAPVSEISLTGKIQARTIIDVPAPTDGIVDRFMADAGEDVFEGELLAQIKNARLDAAVKIAQAAVESAQAKSAELESSLVSARLEASRARDDATRAKVELERAEKVYTRQQLLMRAGATPRLAFEKAESDYQKLKADVENSETVAQQAEDREAALAKDLDAAQTLEHHKADELAAAQADLGSGEVRSPVNGIVLARHGHAGEPAEQGPSGLFQIATNLSDLQVVVAPNPAELSRIRVGQGTTVLIAEAPGPVTGTVREIKSDQVFISFASPSKVIKPGLTAQVKLRLG